MRPCAARLPGRASGSAVGPVTISVGVASPSDGGIEDASALFHAADAALYQAKAAGRNRVVRFVNPNTIPARTEETA